MESNHVRAFPARPLMYTESVHMTTNTLQEIEMKSNQNATCDARPSCDSCLCFSSCGVRSTHIKFSPCLDGNVGLAKGLCQHISSNANTFAFMHLYFPYPDPCLSVLSPLQDVRSR
jgi:hypothetical protein